MNVPGPGWGSLPWARPLSAAGFSWKPGRFGLEHRAHPHVSPAPWLPRAAGFVSRLPRSRVAAWRGGSRRQAGLACWGQGPHRWGAAPACRHGLPPPANSGCTSACGCGRGLRASRRRPCTGSPWPPAGRGAAHPPERRPLASFPPRPGAGDPRLGHGRRASPEQAACPLPCCRGLWGRQR